MQLTRRPNHAESMRRAPTPTPPSFTTPLASRAIAFVAIIGPAFALMYYKWSAATRTLSSVHRSGRWASSIDGLVAARSTLGSSSFYFGKIVVALMIAIILAAGVEAFAIPTLARRLGRTGATTRGQLLAAASGAPLMLCSCCITPVFGAVQRSGATLRNALTLMLASPTMNPAALVLTIMLFPGRVALARFVGAAIIVFLLPRLAEKSEGGAADDALRGAADLRQGYQPDLTGAGAARRYISSLWNVIAHTPILVPGILLSALLIQRHGSLGAVRSSDALALAALIATLIALPTYFEIPLALLAMHAGGSGLAAIVLIAGPAVNLPSLLTIWRQVSAKAAAVIGLGVCLSAMFIAFAVRG